MNMGQLAIVGIDPTDPALQDLVAELDIELKEIVSFDAARNSLENVAPTCFLVDCVTPLGKELSRGIRMSNKLADLPIVALVENPWSQDLSEAFALGVDDYVPRHSLGHIKQKIFAVRKEGAATGAFLSGKVIVADLDRERRVNLARHLRKMGLQVTFAVDGEGIPADVAVKLVVAHCGVAPEGMTMYLKRYRSGPGEKIPWVIAGTKKDLDAQRIQLADEAQVSFFELDADLAQIVSTANQLLIGSARSMRRSPRLTYETAITYEGIDGERPEWGYTYNINRGGLYIRTLTPPALGFDLVLEFTPPYGRGRVKVDATVVWRQEYTGNRGYPPGFGVQYAGTLPVADGAALEAGYDKLLEDSGNPAA